MVGEVDGVKQWSNDVGGLAADALVVAKLVKLEDYGRATEIIAEEILVRVALGDYPPPAQPATGKDASGD